MRYLHHWAINKTHHTEVQEEKQLEVRGVTEHTYTYELNVLQFTSSFNKTYKPYFQFLKILHHYKCGLVFLLGSLHSTNMNDHRPVI